MADGILTFDVWFIAWSKPTEGWLCATPGGDARASAKLYLNKDEAEEELADLQRRKIATPTWHVRSALIVVPVPRG